MHRPRGRRTPGLSTLVATLLSAAAASVRRLIPGVVGLSCLAGLIAPANAAAPVVPLVTAHHHWDHHWFVWLPRHPVYESVEVMSIDSAGGFYRAVWVFFTERHGGKRQVHFFDDRQIVEGFPGSHYRPIDYERSGSPGQGQSVRVALTGLDDVPIEIVVDLADRPLTRTGAGLTNQSGHSADTLFLLFHRDRPAARRRFAAVREPVCRAHESGQTGRPRRSGFGADGRRAALDLALPLAAVDGELSVRVDHQAEWWWIHLGDSVAFPVTVPSYRRNG